MKSLQEVLAEAQALATVSEDQFETALAQVVTDLQALAAAPAVVTTVSLTQNLSDGTTATFVPQAA